MATSKKSNLLPTPTSGRADQEMSPSQEKRHTKNLAQKIQTCSQEDFPASRFPKPENAEARMTTAISGRKCFELSALSNRAGSSLKTCADYLLCKTEWYSSKCVLTWKIPVTKSSRLLFQLSPSTLRTEETGSGLLLTPSAIRPIERKSAESYLKRQANRNKTGRHTVPPGNLYEQLLAGGASDLRKTRLWPKLLGTPKAQDSRAAMRDRGKHNMGEQVQEAINALLPTPRVSEKEGAPVKNAELKNGRWSRVNRKGVRFGVKVKDVLAMIPTPTQADYKSRGRNSKQIGVDNLIKILGTPRATQSIRSERFRKGRMPSPEEVVAMLPTPRAANPGSRPNKKGGKVLNEEVGKEAGLKLQPNFVEWMMGYPQNWTDLNLPNQGIG